jgi:hypothetical protein
MSQVRRWIRKRRSTCLEEVAQSLLYIARKFSRAIFLRPATRDALRPSSAASTLVLPPLADISVHPDEQYGLTMNHLFEIAPGADEYVRVKQPAELTASSDGKYSVRNMGYIAP